MCWGDVRLEVLAYWCTNVQGVGDGDQPAGTVAASRTSCSISSTKKHLALNVLFCRANTVSLCKSAAFQQQQHSPSKGVLAAWEAVGIGSSEKWCCGLALRGLFIDLRNIVY
jgi:hypothetical protein